MMPAVVTALRSCEVSVLTAAEAAPTAASAVTNAKARTIASLILRIHPPVTSLWFQGLSLPDRAAPRRPVAIDGGMVHPQQEGRTTAWPGCRVPLCELRRTTLPRTPVNRGMKEGAEPPRPRPFQPSRS